MSFLDALRELEQRHQIIVNLDNDYALAQAEYERQIESALDSYAAALFQIADMFGFTTDEIEAMVK